MDRSVLADCRGESLNRGKADSRVSWSHCFLHCAPICAIPGWWWLPAQGKVDGQNKVDRHHDKVSQHDLLGQHVMDAGPGTTTGSGKQPAKKSDACWRKEHTEAFCQRKGQIWASRAANAAGAAAQPRPGTPCEVSNRKQTHAGRLLKSLPWFAPAEPRAKSAAKTRSAAEHSTADQLWSAPARTPSSAACDG